MTAPKQSLRLNTLSDIRLILRWIPQHRIHVVPLHLIDHEDLQIVHVHVEHARGTEAHRLQDAAGGRRVFASGERKRVGGYVRVEADGFRRASAALGMGRVELLALALRGERGDALPAYRADGIAELATSSDGGRGPHVDEPHAHPAPDQHRPPTPAERLSAAVLTELKPVHGDAQLETQVLLVGGRRRGRR